VSLGTPLLTAVRPPFDADWESFHSGLGVELPAENGAVVHWAQSVAAARRPKGVAAA
jgi:hypothetical protein